MRFFRFVVIGTFVLIVAAAIALAVAGRRDRAGIVRGVFVTAAPPDSVWAWLTEPARIVRWQEGIAVVRQDSLAPGAPGSRQVRSASDTTAAGRPCVVVTVVRAERPRRLEQSLRAPGLYAADEVVTLAPVAGGTRVARTLRVRWDSWAARALEPLLTPRAAAQVAADGARLDSLASPRR